MGEVKTIDMTAHGTWKTKTKAMCSLNKNTSTWPAKQKSPAMCKTGHESTQPMKNTSCVQQHKTQQSAEECTAEQTRDRTLTQQDRT